MKLALGTVFDLEQLLPDGCDVVFHVAANTTFWRPRYPEQTRDNVDGTRAVVRAVLARKVKRLVHTSSISAWGTQKEIPFDETRPKAGIHAHANYPRTKHLADLEVDEGVRRGLDAVKVAPAHVLGPHDKHNWSRFIRLIHEEKLPGIPDGEGSFAWAPSVARAHIAAAERGRTGEDYILGGPRVSYLEFARVAGALLGKRVPTKVTPRWVLAVVARAMDVASRVTGKEPDFTPDIVAEGRYPQVVTCEKAARELGYDTPAIEPMIEETYRWMKSAGLLAGAGERGEEGRR